MDASHDWLSALTEAVAERLVAAALPAPMGSHVQRVEGPDVPPGGTWEVSLFYGKTEVLGGPLDGRRTDTPFWLDVAGLRQVFNRIDAVYWQSAPLGPSDDLGPHVAVEGEYLGYPVRVRILAAAPERFPSARSADTLKGTFVDLW